MTFENEMKKYLALSKEDRLKKVLNLLALMKDKNEDLARNYEKLKTGKYSGETVDKIYKVLLEAMLYQQSLNEKKEKQNYDKINNLLSSQLEKENLEKIQDEKDLENLLDFD